MGRRRQLVIGLIMLIGGLVVIAIGTIFPSTDPLVALGWLLFVPVLVSICGTVLVFVGLARQIERAPRSAAIYRILGLAAVAGLGLALGYGAAGILSQVPDSLAGLNGPFVPGSAQGLSALFLIGVGLLVGLVIGAVVGLIWWSLRGRHMPSAGEGT
ncbi:MAG: hypothetical protein QOH69_2235 [Actinomycetota bacterium]|nr:hypothetical protein [Actinomycetota bacterium]